MSHQFETSHKTYNLVIIARVLLDQDRGLEIVKHNVLRQGVGVGELQLGLHAKKWREINYIFSISVSFRGHKKLEPCPLWSPLRVKFTISDEHTPLFRMGVPPPARDNAPLF